MRLSRFCSSAGKPGLGASGWASTGPQSQGGTGGQLRGGQPAKVSSLGEAGGHELGTYYVLGKIPPMKRCFLIVSGVT